MRLVQDFVDFQNWPLPLSSVWPYHCHQACSRLALELHYDAADIGGVWHAQKHSSLYDIEIGVVFVRVIESYRDKHRGRVGVSNGDVEPLLCRCDVMLSEWVTADCVWAE